MDDSSLLFDRFEIGVEIGAFIDFRHQNDMILKIIFYHIIGEAFLIKNDLRIGF